MKRLFLLLSFCFAGTVGLSAQSPEPTFVYITDLIIEGNNKTKPQIITREMNFSVGDSIPLPELGDRLEFNRLQLMNTGLFTSVLLNIRQWNADNEITVVVEVLETWYLYPVPVFELADRNFNVWWVEYNRSLNRINYGLHFYHFNFTGHRDLLDILGQLGFTNKLELEYSLPFINKKQTWGLTTDFLLARNRELNYITEEDKQVFNRSDDLQLLRRFRAGLGLTYRPRLQMYQRFKVKYFHNRIAEEVRSDLNPDFLLGRLQQQYFELGYDFVLDQRDIRPYPIKGQFLFLNLKKEGIGWFKDINSLYITGEYRWYRPIAGPWSFAGTARGRVALIREQQPFFNSQALGYEADYVRGYEYYVIDGLDYFYTKANLRFEVLNRTINFGKLVPLQGFRLMPLRLQLVAFNDLGYANNPYYGANNNLANRLLVGYGLGLNIVAYYNMVFRLEASRNGLGEIGFFLNWDLTL